MKNKINNNARHKAHGTRKKKIAGFIVLLLVPCLLFLGSSFTSCNIYRFKDVSIPDTIKTVKVNYIDNKARYINPQLSPQLTDKLRQKIVGQTRLTQTNNDNADWEIGGFITDYSLSTSAISNQREATNRLTVSVRITLNNHRAEKIDVFEVSRNFEFNANQSLQQAEASLGTEIIRSLTDEIFNKLFSNW